MRRTDFKLVQCPDCGGYHNPAALGMCPHCRATAIETILVFTTMVAITNLILLIVFWLAFK